MTNNYEPEVVTPDTFDMDALEHTLSFLYTLIAIEQKHGYEKDEDLEQTAMFLTAMHEELSERLS